MTFGTGLDHVFAMKEEVTFNSYEAPDLAFDNLNDGMQFSRPRLEANVKTRGLSVLPSSAWIPGRSEATGPSVHNFLDRRMAPLLRAIFGGGATTGAGPTYAHTFSPQNELPSYTLHFERADCAPTDRPFAYTGCMVNRARFRVNVDGFFELQIDWWAAGEDLGQTSVAGTAAYPSGAELLSFVGASATVGGSGLDLSSFELSVNNNLATGRRFLGNTTKKPKVQRRTIDGVLIGEFEDLVEYNRFVNGDEFAIVATVAGVTNSSHNLATTLNARYDGETPRGGTSDGVLEQRLPFKAIASGSTDATALTAVYTSPDSAITPP